MCVFACVSTPKCVGGDGHDALGALFRGEAGSVLQGLVGQGREVEPRLVGVAEPGAARHGQHLQGATQRSELMSRSAHFEAEL